MPALPPLLLHTADNRQPNSDRRVALIAAYPQVRGYETSARNKVSSGQSLTGMRGRRLNNMQARTTAHRPVQRHPNPLLRQDDCGSQGREVSQAHPRATPSCRSSKGDCIHSVIAQSLHGAARAAPATTIAGLPMSPRSARSISRALLPAAMAAGAHCWSHQPTRQLTCTQQQRTRHTELHDSSFEHTPPQQYNNSINTFASWNTRNNLCTQSHSFFTLCSLPPYTGYVCGCMLPTLLPLEGQGGIPSTKEHTTNLAVHTVVLCCW